MAKPTRSPLAPLYQLKILLEESDPPIWRRVLISGGAALDALHYAIQDAFGWNNSHLHCFVVGEGRYGMVEIEEDSPDLQDERRFLLHAIAGEKATFRYEYDYGDSWSHQVTVERVIPNAELKRPICLDGQRACPPEDVGGVGGYFEFLAAISNPRHEQHRELLDWAGEGFDPERFDLAEANAALRSSRTERLTRRAMRRG